MVPGRIGGGEMGEGQLAAQQANRQKQADYLASLNLSSVEQWQYPLKIAARPTGKATQVVITEYDLPKRTRQPHDVIVDKEGIVWYASFGEPVLGKLDPSTGKTTEYPIPVLKPGHINGNLDLELDDDQNLWIAMTFQAGVAKFDRKTSEKFTIYKLPPEMDGDYREFTFAAASHSKVDGKVWVNDSGTWTILRLDTATGKWETFEPFPQPRPNIYEVTVRRAKRRHFHRDGPPGRGKNRCEDRQDFDLSFPVAALGSAPRFGGCAEPLLVRREPFEQNRNVLISRRNEVQEWAVPVPFYLPYDVTGDKYGDAWAVDRVQRLGVAL